MCNEQSIEPSLTQIISISLSDCDNIESRHSSKYFSTLKTGIITDTFIMFSLLSSNIYSNIY